jgi:hypothetical protein
MTSDHLHLILNHLPVLGIPFGFILLIIGILKTEHVLKQAGFMVLFFASIAAMPVYFSGESTEEDPQAQLPLDAGAHDRLEQHEDFAKPYLLLSLGLGLLSGYAFVSLKKNKPEALWLRYATLGLALGLSVYGTIIANSGGKIRRPHWETNSPSAQPADED